MLASRPRLEAGACKRGLSLIALYRPAYTA